MDLNSAQQQAVTHDKGPLLIVAGAGTGKTTVITKRIEWLIQQQKIDPQRIFAATFTQKAAEEMLGRLDEIMPLSYQEPWIGTFHSIADKLLRDQGLEIGLNPNYRILTQTDQWLFIKAHLNDLKLKYYAPLGNPNKFISALLKFFSRLQDEDVEPEEFNQLISKKKVELKSNTDPQAQLEYESN
jgi:DNA helicase II / ATP-dependent DNA helicase PcrA